MNKIALTLIFGLFSSALAIEKHKLDFVVGVDGDFKAAMAAAAAASPSESKRFVIFFPEGEYDLTNLTADTHGKTTFSTSFVSFIGETRDKAIISNVTDTEGISITATLYFPKNNGIYMQDLTIQNKSSFATSNAARQVAIQQKGDKYIFKNVRLLSGQDTYYTKGTGRTYWEGGEIRGTVDFICGDGNVFFEGTNLVMTKNGGYITAASTTAEWGYVFNKATINVSNSSYNGSFYLGRSWNHAKTVFLNTIMYAQPTAAGWGPDMNSAPTIYGEYNSKDGNGNAINTSGRENSFNGGNDATTATTLKTVWDASDAANYTLSNVLSGTDSWDPTKLTVQANTPAIIQSGSTIFWPDDDSALCWVIFVDGKYKTSVITNSFDLDGIAVGSKITVRAANSMGGLGGTSNAISVVENATLGSQGAFQAEDGAMTNATSESTNAGFVGTGYVNFNAGNSSVKVPVYVDSAGSYKMEMFYANGSTADRDLTIATQDTTQQATFEKTGAWTIYQSKEIEVTLPQGISFIEFAVVGNSDGPNLDQLVLTPVKEETPAENTPADVTPADTSAKDSSTIGIAQKVRMNALPAGSNVQVFSVQGKLIREFKANNAGEIRPYLAKLPAGTYLVRTAAPGYKKQEVIRVQ